MKKIHTSVRLKEILEERDLKQADVVRLCKPYLEMYGERLGRNDLSQYLSGKTEPGQRKLFILAKALDINPAWLMGMDVTKSNNETSKKNDAITDIILLLRTDDELLEIVTDICSLSSEKRNAVRTLISAFEQQ